jgi:hypothetical protein
MMDVKNWPIGAKFWYKSRYGEEHDVIEGVVANYYDNIDDPNGYSIVSTRGVVYPASSIIIETVSDFRENRLNELLR